MLLKNMKLRNPNLNLIIFQTLIFIPWQVGNLMFFIFNISNYDLRYDIARLNSVMKYQIV